MSMYEKESLAAEAKLKAEREKQKPAKTHCSKLTIPAEGVEAVLFGNYRAFSL